MCDRLVAINEHPVFTIFLATISAVSIETRSENLIPTNTENREDGLTVLVIGIAMDTQCESRVAVSCVAISEHLHRRLWTCQQTLSLSNEQGQTDQVANILIPGHILVLELQRAI